MYNEDEEKYGYHWSEYNSSVKIEEGMENINNAFQYKSSSDLQGLPYRGKFETYGGGGYVYKMRGKLEYLQGNLTILQNMGWIDRKTRAVFAEFTVYNPNLNILMVCTIFFEFLPSGNILMGSTFEPLNLFNEIGSNGAVKMLFSAVYLIFLIYLMIDQFIRLYKKKLDYFKGYWIYVDWIIIIFSWTSVGIFAYRYATALEVLTFFSETSGYAYIKLQKMNYYNQIFDILSSLCVFLATLRCIDTFKFSDRMYFLSFTLKACVYELVGLFLLFFIFWLAFVQVLFLLQHQYSYVYSDIILTMETSLLTLLGKFDSNEMLGRGSFLVPLMFFAYNFFMVIMIINLFITMLSQAFKEVREEISNKENQYDLINLLKRQFKILRGKKIQTVKDIEYFEYVDSTNAFPDKVDELIDRVYLVIILLYTIITHQKLIL
jgi:polycystin 1L2